MTVNFSKQMEISLICLLHTDILYRMSVYDKFAYFRSHFL